MMKTTPYWGASAFLVVFQALCPAEISNVLITGTTPTQAVLTYTAPNDSPCTIQVSERPSYSPVVHDFDEALFARSSSDARPGSVTSGRSRLVVIGKHGMSSKGPNNQFLAADGNRYSRALQANSTHYYRVQCGSDTAAGTFTTGNPPLGNTYPEPLASDQATPGAYNWPSATDGSSRAEAFVDPNTGVLIRKITMAAENNAPRSNYNLWPSGGMFQVCSHALATADGHVYDLCVVPSAIYPTLYSIDTTTGDAYALTRISVRSETLGCPSTAPPDATTFSASDPLKIYFVATCGDGHGPRVYAARWTGPLNASNPVPASTSPVNAALNVGVLTPNGIKALVAAFDPLYNGAQQALLTYAILDGAQDGKLLFHIVSQQDSMGWVVVFDPGNDLPIGSGGTGGVVAANPFWRSPASRWCTLHTLTTAGDNNPWISVQSNSPFADGVRMGSRYSVTVASNAGTGNIIQLAPTNGSYEPQSTTGDPSYVQDAQPGDLFWVNAIGPGGGVEPIELVSKDTANHAWTVLRGNQLSQSKFIQGSNMSAVVVAPANITAGAKLYAACRATSLSAEAYGGGMWYWNYATDPHGTSAVYPAAEGTASNQVVENHSSGGHQVARDAINVMARFVGSSVGWLWWTYPNGTPGYSAATGSNFINGSPKFAGVGQAGANTYQMHPSYDQTAAADDEKQWFVDAAPLINGGIIYPASGALVSGQNSTYKMANTSIHRKHVTTFSSCGAHPLVDISGPASAISDSTPYTYCVAEGADECRRGSTRGDVYVSCPGVTKTTCDSVSRGAAVDICIGDSWAYGNGAVQASGVRRDGNGGTGRLVASLFATHHEESLYNNVRPTSDGRWLLFTTPNLTGLSEVYMAKLPPFPVEDSTRRDTFVPVSVTVRNPIVARGTRVVVAFGYAENGDPASFYCTSREESCVSQSSTIDESLPFYFSTTEAGSVTGMPCDSACTVTIPALPGRIVYYRVITLYSTGKVILRQRVSASAVP